MPSLPASAKPCSAAFSVCELETLIGYYRLSSLQHHISRGGGGSPGQPYSEDVAPTLFRSAPSR